MALGRTYLKYVAVLSLFMLYKTISRLEEFDFHGVDYKIQAALEHEINQFTTAPPLLDTEIQARHPGKKRQNFYKNDTNEGMNQNVFEGVKAGPFQRWKGEIPCFEPESDWKNKGAYPAKEGILFTKPVKTGSSTAAGINLRVARNVARRQGSEYPICKARFDHAPHRNSFSERNRDKSFLWTVVRDPTDRIVSQFYHFWVSRLKRAPTDYWFKRYVRSYLSPQWAGEHYQNWLSPEPDGSELRQNKAAYINKILESYDFIAVTERMEESAVALAMLLNVPLADVLYLSSKVNGGLDDGGHNNTCFAIQPGYVSSGMEEFFKSDYFQNTVHWDHVLHQAANRSLDLTIDHLGREEFAKNLALYRKAQNLAVQRCASHTVFPCSKSDVPPVEKTDCLWRDSGCGYKCLDDVATKLNLWDSSRAPEKKSAEIV